MTITWFLLHPLVLSAHLALAALFCRGLAGAPSFWTHAAKPTSRWTSSAHILHTVSPCNISRDTVSFHPSLFQGFNVPAKCRVLSEHWLMTLLQPFSDVPCNYLYWRDVRRLYRPTAMTPSSCTLFSSHSHRHPSCSLHALHFQAAVQVKTLQIMFFV